MNFDNKYLFKTATFRKITLLYMYISYYVQKLNTMKKVILVRSRIEFLSSYMPSKLTAE